MSVIALRWIAQRSGSLPLKDKEKIFRFTTKSHAALATDILWRSLTKSDHSRSVHSFHPNSKQAFIMPPHMPRYKDFWWESMPETAHKAAKVLGYDQESWDKDKKIPYDAKSFPECTGAEKCAALFLSMHPLDTKLDIWWDDVDEETQKQATILTWSKHSWDHDWNIRDLPCEHWWWKDMTAEQKEAAAYFGYTQHTWDETGEDVFEVVEGKPGKKKFTLKPNKKNEDTSESSDSGKSNNKKKFSMSKAYGGDGGSAFDHRTHRFIEAIEVFGNKVVDGLKVTYNGHTVQTAGDVSGSGNKVALGDGEYIDKVTVRHEKLVQELTFHTNKGKTHGPFGGHGRMLKDRKGEVSDIRAPLNSSLVGFAGRNGKVVDAISFHWGPVPK